MYALRFLAAMAGSLAFLLGPASADLQVMLGHTTGTEVKMWVKGDTPGRLGILLSESPEALARSEASFARDDLQLREEDEFMTIAQLSGLTPATRYYYQLTLDGEPAGDASSLVTAASADGRKPGRLRFAFTSCLGRAGSQAEPGWVEMAKLPEVDLVFLLGDNHYADTTERVVQSAAYASHRGVPSFKQIARRTPIYGIWDDHDYGPNDSDGTADGKENSLATFKDFWPNPAYGEPDNPGIYYQFSRAGIDFFMLDCRYHRSPDKAPQDASKTMLGARQLAWLKAGLKASEAKVKVVATGSEWQLNGHRDSWTSYRRERAEILDFIRDEEITGVLLLSGDRHFTGGYQIRGEVIEITAGPLGSKNFPSKNLPEMFLNYGEGKMFCVFDIDTAAAPDPGVILEVYRDGAGLIDKREFGWAQVLGQEKLELLPVPPAKPEPKEKAAASTDEAEVETIKAGREK